MRAYARDSALTRRARILALSHVTDVPRISVLISSYSNARFVAKKLAEVHAQTIFQDAEFLFIETASPEREREMFKPFCGEHPNCRVVVTDQRKSLYEAWNLGWREARAPFVCYSNMDDAMHPRLLEEVASAMERERWDACTVLIAKQSMDEQWNDWSRVNRLPLSTRPGPFAAWRKELSETVGWFDERFLVAGDKEFWSRLAAANLCVGLIPKVLYLYTRNPQSLSLATRQGGRWQAEKALLAETNSGWPMAIRRRIRWIRFARALMPSRYTVPLPA
jgi:cellulose synthase/poly-beta-1,6-N-acetylglucosamine synthase-like glycosyltransferase